MRYAIVLTSLMFLTGCNTLAGFDKGTKLLVTNVEEGFRADIDVLSRMFGELPE